MIIKRIYNFCLKVFSILGYKRKSTIYFSPECEIAKGMYTSFHCTECFSGLCQCPCHSKPSNNLT